MLNAYTYYTDRITHKYFYKMKPVEINTSNRFFSRATILSINMNLPTWTETLNTLNRYNSLLTPVDHNANQLAFFLRLVLKFTMALKSCQLELMHKVYWSNHSYPHSLSPIEDSIINNLSVQEGIITVFFLNFYSTGNYLLSGGEGPISYAADQELHDRVQ